MAYVSTQHVWKTPIKNSCFLRLLLIYRIRRAKTEHYRNVCADISAKPKSTWRQLNLVLGRTKRRAVSLINWEEKTLIDPASIVNTLVQHFSSVAVPSPSTSECQITPSLQVSVSVKSCTEEDVRKKLSGLDERKATGPDMIPAKLLKMVAPAISTSLTKLFNYSLSQGVFPSEWKQANVTPVPKSGDRHMVNNYRPISVIPVIAKVFESMVHGQLYEYLGRNKIMSEEQAGFRPNRSTQDALLRAIDDWKSALDSGQTVAAVMIDLSKAYDSINHNLLLKKLHVYGVQGG